MPYPTTDTTAFNLDLSEIIEEAGERAGYEIRTGHDFKTARRSLNLMMMEWANWGFNLWSVQETAVPLTYGQAAYPLPADTVDIVDQILRTGINTQQSDIRINRVALDMYAPLTNKNALGRPNQLWFNRRSGATSSANVVQTPEVVLWPVPDASGYTLVCWRLRRLQDAGTGANGADIPFRFLPALVAGLAYYLALKLPNAAQRLPALKAQYDEEFQRAREEDREKVPFRIYPARSHV
jgi:hypothetical protein